MASAVRSERDSAREAMVMPPPTISRTRKKVDIETKSAKLSVARTLQVQEIAGYGIFLASPSPIWFPLCQFKDAIRESSQVPIGCCER
jgi:hypothetical protein